LLLLTLVGLVAFAPLYAGETQDVTGRHDSGFVDARLRLVRLSSRRRRLPGSRPAGRADVREASAAAALVVGLRSLL
jgi:hypothetical protein